MKLLYCIDCHSVFNLRTESEKSCICGKSKGQYTDNLNAWYEGPCLPLGFANSSFSEAIYNQPEKDWGKDFGAFVIQKDCDTFVRRGEAPVLPTRKTESERLVELFSLFQKTNPTPAKVRKTRTVKKKTKKTASKRKK